MICETHLFDTNHVAMLSGRLLVHCTNVHAFSQIKNYSE